MSFGLILFKKTSKFTYVKLYIEIFQVKTSLDAVNSFHATR
jgi:hypothetical protein